MTTPGGVSQIDSDGLSMASPHQYLIGGQADG